MLMRARALGRVVLKLRVGREGVGARKSGRRVVRPRIVSCEMVGNELERILLAETCWQRAQWDVQ